MARVGKSEVFICAGCNKPINLPPSDIPFLIPDKSKPQEKVWLHPGMECAEYWAFSGPLAEKMEQAMRREIERFWAVVDPVTRQKMRKYL
jgi:hypothetical protein